MKAKILGLVAVGILAGPMAAQADTIDFSAFSSGNTGLSTLAVGIATFDVPGGTVFVYRPGDFGAFTTSGGICALAGGNCQTDWSLAFNAPVMNLMFEAAFYNAVDSVLVEAFNGATSLGSFTVNANGTYGFAGTLTRLVFNDSSTGAGFGFGDFSYDLASVPEPGTLALLGLGLAGLGLSRRRKAH